MTDKPKQEKGILKPKEIEALIVKLGKEGKNPAEIGLILRDEHGVPRSKPSIGKRISKVLEENDIEPIDDIKIIEEKIERNKAHIAKNKHDYTSTKALTKRLWTVQKMKKKL